MKSFRILIEGRQVAGTTYYIGFIYGVASLDVQNLFRGTNRVAMLDEMFAVLNTL